MLQFAASNKHPAANTRKQRCNENNVNFQVGKFEIQDESMTLEKWQGNQNGAKNLGNEKSEG